MVDVNDIQYKQEHQRLQSLRTQVVLWLVVLALGVALIPLMLITRWVRNDVTRLEAELWTVQSALNSATSPSEEVIKLSVEITRINQLATSLQTVTIPSGLNWPLVVDAAAQYDATAIEITELTQTDNKIQISGRATSNDAVVRFQQTLLESAAFRDVVVVSMSALPVPPTPVVAETRNEADAAVVTVKPPFGNVAFVMDIVVGPSSP